MKTIATALLILAFATPCAAETHLIIVAGQSNAGGGAGNLTTHLTDEQATIPTNAEVWVKRDEGVIRHLESFRDTKLFGPEVTFVHRICASAPNDHFIVAKFSRGNSGLPAWSPMWSCSDADLTNDCAKGPLYQRLQEVVKAAMQGRSAKLSGILWVQGEKDSAFVQAANQYTVRLNALIQALRTAYGNQDAPIILAVTNPPLDYAWKVSQQQIDTAWRLHRYYPVSTEGLRKNSDDIHYTWQSSLKLGQRSAWKWIGGEK